MLDLDLILDTVLLGFLLVMAAAILKARSLLSMAMLFSIYSLLCAGLFLIMDAPDVAFTEAAVGAGISTVLILATIAVTGVFQEKNNGGTDWSALLIVLVTGAGLVYGTHDIANVGDALSPANVGVAQRYIEQGEAETGVPNLVTAVLASYRGFDTLGEVVVVFTAGVGVLLLLGAPQMPGLLDPKIARRSLYIRPNLVLKVIAKFLIPFILLFALYVQFHGDYSPGGGFQAGVIFCSALVFYTLAFGLDATLRSISIKQLRLLAAAGVMLYSLTGVATMLFGGNFLDYNQLADHAKDGQHLGIILIELGVGMTVAAVMMLLFFTFARWSRPE